MEARNDIPCLCSVLHPQILNYVNNLEALNMIVQCLRLILMRSSPWKLHVLFKPVFKHCINYCKNPKLTSVYKVAYS